MNMLEEYIRDHISLVNKNNHIHIIVGEKICVNMKINPQLKTIQRHDYSKYMGLRF